MSGHSKWHNIKVKKTKMDSQRGKVFTKLSKEIIIAAKQGGADPENNYRLKMAIQRAKESNMPSDNIKRTIDRATGGEGGTSIEEITYEGYGPSGVALMVDAATDNRNRTAADLRSILGKHGGNLGESGCVAWMFKKRGLITVEAGAMTEDQMLEAVLEAGAEDMMLSEGLFEIYTDPSDLKAVKENLEEQGIKVQSAEVSMLPLNTVKLESNDASRVLKLMDALEDHDDVQHVYSNFDIPESVMEELAV
jgi:YebC/PmpR family DNA-binding regulatory protein